MAIQLCSQITYVYKELYTTQISLKQLHSNKQENKKSVIQTSNVSEIQ